MISNDWYLRMTRDGVYSRRSFLRDVAVGTGGLAALSWMDTMRLHAHEMRKQGKACILLFMPGGPSQFETFDPKPGTETGGPTQAIDTAVPGIRIAEHWPRVAEQMKELAIIRSMTNREGNHQRAQYELHTGYALSGSIKYPSLGAIVASELADPGFDLPHYVHIGGRDPAGSGFLGMTFAPFTVMDPNRMPANVELPRGTDPKRFTRRLQLMEKLERDFAEAGAEAKVADHKAVYETASQMVLSPRIKAFDLSQEKDALRDRYGRTPFGQGCLLARRLVETGVTFVEVQTSGGMGVGNWDTHDNNFERHKTLAGITDPAFAALIADLKDRGMLERTLVIWMGEFGRTPNINGRNGRDHYPRAFSVVLAGCGIRGGMVYGQTDPLGRAVVENPVTVRDLFSTICHALGINPAKENMSSVGRPIKIVDGGTPIKALLS
ncbi:MAG: DUF1501 domain-containing protein [Gemmatales bacterium]|nr:DUF1501 domain-containing protein [Gemmatales bacterium]MDW8388087.1 DUF1501 domain-containing protein [Gemmatales bacterium]